MVGRKIRAVPRVPLNSLALLAIGVVGGGIALLLQSVPIGLLAVFPFFLGWFLLIASSVRGGGFEVTLTEDALVLAGQQGVVPYEDLQIVLHPTNNGGQSPIYLIHENGALTIPDNIDAPSAELAIFLEQHISHNGARSVNGVLAAYLDGQIAKFGEDHVWSYVARPILQYPAMSGIARPVAWTAVVTGFCWFVYGTGTANTGWMFAGIVAWIVSVPLFFVGRTRSAPTTQARNWRESSLVIGPLGLALAQGDLKGELRWDQIRDVRFGGKTGDDYSLTETCRGIVLKVEGAEVRILDFYDRSLPTIHGVIMKHWRS